MGKGNIVIFSLVIILLISISIAEAKIPSDMINLRGADILPSQNVNISLNGRKMHINLIKHEGIIYSKIDDLITIFGCSCSYDESRQSIKVNNAELPTYCTGYSSENGKTIVYLPVLQTLNLLNIRYIYNDLYDKERLSIRTDEFIDYRGISNSQNVIAYGGGYGGYGGYGGGYSGGAVTSVPELAAINNYDTRVLGLGLRPMYFNTGWCGGSIYRSCGSIYGPGMYSSGSYGW
ncbi:MAG: hypothetical protein ABRQ37_14170 [Candidatus Eremiobacterota bacterium]